MEENYSLAIQDCIAHSNIIIEETKTYSTEISVIDKDSVSAAFDFAGSHKKVCILNFASFKTPGGKFYDGSSAQEECLCHSSNLYPVLRAFKDIYYKLNEKMLNNVLYSNRAIYSEDVLFFKNYDLDSDYNKISNQAYFDVLTCACPNKSAAQKYKGISEHENSNALKSRIKFVLDTAQNRGVDIFILGAYGCGVFGQNPYEVAYEFKKQLTNRSFERVVFAIPGGNNLKAFEEVFDIK